MVTSPGFGTTTLIKTIILFKINTFEENQSNLFQINYKLMHKFPCSTSLWEAVTMWSKGGNTALRYVIEHSIHRSVFHYLFSSMSF